MADLIENNTESTPLNLGTLSYDTEATSFNIYKTDTVSMDDRVDYFTINTIGIDELKVDIHPIGLTGDYSYALEYRFLQDWITGNSGIDTVILYGDGGVNDGMYNSYMDHYGAGASGYAPYKSDNSHLVRELADGTKGYMIFDDTSFNHEFDPHLTVTPKSDGSVDFYVYLSTSSPSGEDLSYVIDITPISAEALTTASAHLLTYDVTMEVANEFIMSNIDHLGLIYDTCKTFGVTNDMVAEILADDFPGLTGEIVANHFANNGIDTTDLGGSIPSIDIFIA